MKKLLGTLMAILIASPAFAMVERVDNSMTLVYAFLGLCGMIIFLQILPVLALAFGMVRGIFKKEKIVH